MIRLMASSSRTPSRRPGARLFALCLLGMGLATAPVRAEDKPDPVLAKIGSEVIRLSDLTAAAEALQPQLRQMPREQLLPRLLDQMVDTRVLAAEARKAGIDKDPAVLRAVRETEERALVSLILEREIGPRVNDAAVRARFDQELASQPPPAEIHARHILVDDEAAAKKIIADLKKGGDFAALSKQYSKDAAAVEAGGDLGFFKAADMVPEFSAAAFALKDKEVAAAPVHTQFGWHVIQTLERRAGQPPAFEQAREELRQRMINEEVRKVVAKARASVTIERFNLDGTPSRATDGAVPPPAK